MFRNLINLIYPNICSCCKKALQEQEIAVCTNCFSELPKTNYYLNKENPVAKLFWGKVKIEHAISSFEFTKKGKIQFLMHALKYNGKKEIGEILGVEMGKDLNKLNSKIDFLIPVPLHPKKLKKRGYNQSEHIAVGIQKVINAEIGNDFLIRTENIASQTKKGRFERWTNVGNTFKCVEPRRLENKHVLIIDDVVTTGATIEACVEALKDIKGIVISVSTIARA